MIFKLGDSYSINDSEIKMVIDSVEDEKRIYYHLTGEGINVNNAQIITINYFEELINMGEIEKC